MKPYKVVLLSYSTLFLISLVFVWFTSEQTISCGVDRPQWEESFTVWDYFFVWSGLSLIVNAILCLITIGIYSISIWALRQAAALS